MSFHVFAQYKTKNGRTETTIGLGDWDTARACAIEHFFKLYNGLCNEVGDRLDTFLQVGYHQVKEIPFFLIRETLNDDLYKILCKDGHNIQLSMDGGDNVFIRYYGSL